MHRPARLLCEVNDRPRGLSTETLSHCCPYVRTHREYTFAGRVGKITLVPDDLEEEQYAVTFNDGRTSYLFNQEHLQIEQDNNYEVIRWKKLLS